MASDPIHSHDSNKTVALIVDDSPETLSMLNETLDNAGHTVLVAMEGQQALMITQNITPDIILLDALMPNMDGFETCRKIKEIPKLAHVPVIFMTGLSDSASIVKGLEAGGVDYVTKPINSDELVARMRVHLTNAQLAQSARNALDNTGNFLFAVNAYCEIIWATPQARELFSGGKEIHLDDQACTQIKQLSDPRFNKEKSIFINQGGKQLEIKYVGVTNDGDLLLRLMDLERPSDTQSLSDAFSLTEREAEVLLWVARGKTNREIGTILTMSPRTVNKHLEPIFRKLGVENRTSAAAMALKIMAGE